jgi:hypothetical protein
MMLKPMATSVGRSQALHSMAKLDVLYVFVGGLEVQN